MHRYEREFNTLVVLEQRLLNARSEVRAAEHLVGHGQLDEEIRAIAEALDDTIALAQRAKHIMLNEWRAAEASQAAA